MAQQFPGPQQPFGQAPQGPMPPQKKSDAGKIVGFGCLGVVGFFVLIGILAALVGGGGDDGAGTSDGPAAAATTDSSPKSETKPKDTTDKPAPDAPVKLVAKATQFRPSVLHNGGEFTSVEITVTNNSDKNVDVNPLSFAITDTHGTKHPTDALGEDENQIDALTLAPGENVSGAITAEGSFTPKTVTFNEDFFGEPIRADVK